MDVQQAIEAGGQPPKEDSSSVEVRDLTPGFNRYFLPCLHNAVNFLVSKRPL